MKDSAKRELVLRYCALAFAQAHNTELGLNEQEMAYISNKLKMTHHQILEEGKKYLQDTH